MATSTVPTRLNQKSFQYSVGPSELGAPEAANSGPAFTMQHTVNYQQFNHKKTNIPDKVTFTFQTHNAVPTLMSESIGGADPQHNIVNNTRTSGNPQTDATGLSTVKLNQHTLDPKKTTSTDPKQHSTQLAQIHIAQGSNSEGLGIIGTYSDSSECDSASDMSPDKSCHNTAMPYFFQTENCHHKAPTNVDVPEQVVESMSKSHQQSQSQTGAKEANSFTDMRRAIKSQRFTKLWSGYQNKLDDTMAVFIRLRMAIERLDAKKLFPYKARPLLKLLEQCEQLYEQ